MTTLETLNAGVAEAAAESDARHAVSMGLPSHDTDLFGEISESMRNGLEFLFSVQREELFWCAELESNATITSEYVMLLQMLGLDISRRKSQLSRFLLGEQKADGGWGISTTSESDVSTTAEAYLALRILGLEANHPALRKAEQYVLTSGGLEKIRVFTRIFFAMFGLLPWSAVPALPPEFLLLPPRTPVNAYALASWARGTMIPLFVIFHHKPVFALPNGRISNNDWLDHLWLDKRDKNVPYMPSWRNLVLSNGCSYETLFGTVDVMLKMYDPYCAKGLRRKALDKCMSYILDHQEESGDWGGIFPPMINGIIALTLEGYTLDSDPVRRGLQAIENFSWEDHRGLRIQACVSPTWDTALSIISLLDCQVSPTDPRIKGAIDWLLSKQIKDRKGDWSVYRPRLLPGGWSFEYNNTWYPDVDDTAAVLLALMKQDPGSAFNEPVFRAIKWILGMQNSDGGWAAFDVDNDKVYLNKIPFSDMDSLCDTSCPDVTGRVLEAFGLFANITERLRPEFSPILLRTIRASIEKAVAYLRESQEKNGSWYGRWGVAYIYGTSNVLCGLSQIGVPMEDPMVTRALAWLERTQDPNGGWGESIASYKINSYVAAEPCASQTAWALMGLLAYLPSGTPSVDRGAHWLASTQRPAPDEMAWEGGNPLPSPTGWTWEESAPTGTGFPNHFYLNYHLYRHYFPMMALGRYLKTRAN